jgi:DNA primase
MENILILEFLESFLGKGKKTSRGNYAFKCPNGCKADKYKLEININTNESGENPWSCWICGEEKNFKGKKIRNLVKKLNLDPKYLAKLKTLIKPSKSQEYFTKSEILQLPEEFKKFDTTLEAKQAMRYLKRRGISKCDIERYNIGYCSSGQYSGRVIVPSYDGENQLNYYVGRSYFEDENNKIKAPSTSKDIIGFELFINWNLPIIICEGAFDAISIRRNVIPLFGKTISNSLFKKLVNNKVRDIYLILDQDAIKNAIKYAEKLMNYNKNVYLVELDGKDPNLLGFEKINKLINETKPLKFSDLMILKMKYGK